MAYGSKEVKGPPQSLAATASFGSLAEKPLSTFGNKYANLDELEQDAKHLLSTAVS